MTVFYCDGFETIGTSGSAGADIETRLNATDKCTKLEISGGFTNPLALIADFDAVGLALQFDTIDASRGEYIRVEYPDGTDRFPDYKVSTNASVPVFVTGFRLYNAAQSPSQNVTIWRCLQGSGSVMSNLRIDSGGTGLTFTPMTGAATSATSILTTNTWHYIEIEYKPTSSANGGYAKVYVDGVLQIDAASSSVASATFYTTYGVDIGVFAASNEVGGAKYAIDDTYHMSIDGIDDTAVLGPCRVLLLSPTSDATPNDWTPSTGADNYALIDEQNWGTADYFDATVTADDEHYGMTTLSSAITVHGLQVDVVCTAVDGTPSLHIGFDDGGTADEEDMGVIATGSTVQKRMMFETAPATDWDQSEVNANSVTQRMTE